MSFLSKFHIVVPNLLKYVGFVAVVGAAFFSPTPEKVAIFAGAALIAVGFFWGKLVKA